MVQEFILRLFKESNLTFIELKDRRDWPINDRKDSYDAENRLKS